MSGLVLTKSYSEPPVFEREILRYAGCDTSDGETLALLSSALEEARREIAYRVCYRILPLRISGDRCDFGLFSVESGDLAKSLCGAEKVILFSATLGVALDRLIAKYSRLSPSRALVLQAIGTERIEALCDAFLSEIEEELGVQLRPRFSAGYGDLPLSVQRDIFKALDCERQIGVFLNESLIMSPSKSVTAFVGVGKRE